MRKILFILAFLFAIARPAEAAVTSPVTGWCELGGRAVATSGLSSTTKVQQSFPSCVVTVYNYGTGVLATIFADTAGTALGNPFVASTAGQWTFYAASAGYQVVLSGGGIPTPFTIPVLIPGLIVTTSAIATEIAFFTSNQTLGGVPTFTFSMTTQTMSFGSNAQMQGFGGNIIFVTQTGETRVDTPQSLGFSPFRLTGAWITGGSATTTKPYMLIEPGTATSTGWSTLGTGLGINAAAGSANLADFQVNGVSKVRIDSAGAVSAGSVRGTAVTFANRPVTPVAGMLVTINDAPGPPVWGATISVGGSTNTVLAFFNGSAWTVAGR